MTAAHQFASLRIGAAGARRPGRRSVMVRRSWAARFEDGPRLSRGTDRWVDLALRHRLPASSAVSARTVQRVLALTFDDGPDPRDTPGVLEALARHGARATFFLLSDSAERYPRLVGDIAAAGHAVELHGVHHRAITGLDAGQTREMLRRGRETIEGLSGLPVRLYRPAYGALTAGQARLAHETGLDTVIWSAWARDWEGAPPGRVAKRAAGACHPGAVLLLHDTLADVAPHDRGAFDSAAATDLLLGTLRGEQWSLLTAHELLSRHQQNRCAWFEPGGDPGAPR